VEELSIVFQNVLYITEIGETGEPTILVEGRPAKIPERAYLEVAPGIGENTFTCRRCHATVASLLIRGKALQLCHCMVVQHHCYPEREVYQNSKTWEEFRQTYERESLNPTPADSTHKEARAFCQRKLGFKGPIKTSQNGNLVTTSGDSVYVDSSTSTISARLDDQSDSDGITDLMLAYQLKSGGEIPPVMIIVGDDPTHKFPPGTRNITPLPFRCKNCGERVKEGHLNLPLIDLILTCLCMSVLVRRDISAAQSSHDWQSYRDTWLRGQISHRAAAADGRS
jgi:hypothetical protein